VDGSGSGHEGRLDEHFPVKSPYVSELQPNQAVSGVFLVQQKDVRQKKTGEPYLALMLGDRTGDLDAKMWDNAAKVVDTFSRNDFVSVKGWLQVHHNRPQLTIFELARSEENSLDHRDFFPVSERDPADMWAELRGVVEGVANPHLRALLAAVLDDPDIAGGLRAAPAAKAIHHARLGGLLEHVLSLCALGRAAAAHYRVDADLVIAGLVLHDIGKIRELFYDRSFGYSDEGQLLGHIVIGLRMVGDKIGSLPGFPERLRTLVEHMLISHHGSLEFGSPKTPMFPEALLVHHLDNLDSKMESMRVSLERDRQVEGNWTSHNPALDRMVLKKDRYLGEREPSPAAAKREPPQQPARPSTAFGDELRKALDRGQ
jgi:3'-5' exoribonuclease